MATPGSPQALTTAQAGEMQQVFGILQAGHVADALARARRLVAEARGAPDAYQLLGMCHAEAGNAEDAEAAFLHALELAADHPLVLVNYAAMLRKTGRLEHAIATLRRAVSNAPDFAKGWSELGAAAFAAGLHVDAVAALQRAVALQPGSAAGWMTLGNVARAGGSLDTAERAYARVIAIEPGHAAAALGLGTTLRMSGRTDEAVACFEDAARRGDNSPELADSLVGALLDDGRLDDAIQLARQVVREHPGFVPGLVTLANLLWEHRAAQAPADDAFDVMRGAIKLRPNQPELRLAFSQLLLSARMPGEALEQIRTVRAHADQPALVLMEANALEMLDNTGHAGALYLNLNRSGAGELPGFLNAYARHLLRAGEWHGAAQAAIEATRLNPRDQEAWAYLGTAWRLLDDPREQWLCDYERLVALVDIEPPPGFADQATFLDALGATLDGMHKAKRAPMQQSLRGGSQTPGRLFGRRDPVLMAAHGALLRGVEEWLATLPSDGEHPFLMQKTRSVRVGGSWSVKLWSSGNHVNHIHPEGWMSSAFYVSLPPAVLSPSAGASQAGHIQFGQPPVELGLALPPRRVMRPGAGKLALFPSYMWHGTVPFEDQQPRTTVAFDMTPVVDET